MSSCSVPKTRCPHTPLLGGERIGRNILREQYQRYPPSSALKTPPSPRPLRISWGLGVGFRKLAPKTSSLGDLLGSTQSFTYIREVLRALLLKATSLLQLLT